jgi:hypothetical protein
VKHFRDGSRTEETLGLKPNLLAADTAYGTGKFLHWIIGTGITPHIPVSTFSTASVTG